MPAINPSCSEAGFLTFAYFIFNCTICFNSSALIICLPRSVVPVLPFWLIFGARSVAATDVETNAANNASLFLPSPAVVCRVRPTEAIDLA